MNELFRTIVKSICSFATGLLSAASITVFPLSLIHHRHIYEYFGNLNFILIAFFVICIFTSLCVCLRLRQITKKRYLILGISYLFCYVACAALCQKISFTMLYAASCSQINSNLSSPPELIAVPGLVLILLASILQIRAVMAVPTSISSDSSSPSKMGKHPFYQSWLMFMCGVPLIFGVWLPFVALPGAWIFLNWLN